MAQAEKPQEVPKTRSALGRPASRSTVVDYVFFVFGGASAIWLALAIESSRARHFSMI